MNGGRNERERAGRSVVKTGAVLVAFSLLLQADTAQAAVDEESQFVLNTFSFLIWGALVMWMCAGFTMLESGSVRTKNASVICLKNIGLYSVAGLAYYFIGYNLMYVDVGSWVGSVTFLYGPSADELALLSDQTEALGRCRREWLRRHVGLVFSDGLCRDGRLDCVRHSGRTGQAVVVSCLHDRFDGNYLSHYWSLDLGWRLAE